MSWLLVGITTFLLALLISIMGVMYSHKYSNKLHVTLMIFTVILLVVGVFSYGAWVIS